MTSKHYLLQIDRVDDNIDINHDRTDKSFSVLFRQGPYAERTQPIKGKNKLQWETFFPLTLDDEQNQIELQLTMDSETVGSKLIHYKTLKKQIGRQSFRVLLEKNGRQTAILFIKIERHEKEDIKGGIHTPKVCLNLGREFSQTESVLSDVPPPPPPRVEEPRREEPVERPRKEKRGLQMNRTEKLNMFSCMDERDLENELFPDKFRSKCSK